MARERFGLLLAAVCISGADAEAKGKLTNEELREAVTMWVHNNAAALETYGRADVHDTRAHACTHTHTDTHTHVSTHMCICVYVCVETCVCVCVCTHFHTRTCVSHT